MRAGWPCATAKRRGLARSFIHRACGSLAMAGCVMILDAAHSSTTRCVMPLCVRRVTAQREPTRGSWVRHETDIGTGENEGGLHICLELSKIHEHPYDQHARGRGKFTTSAVFHPEYSTSTIAFRRSTFASWAVHQCTGV